MTNNQIFQNKMNQARLLVDGKLIKPPLRTAQPFPRWFMLLFAIFCIYLVVPFVDVPFLGLSISAPIFYLLTVHIVLKRKIRFAGWYQGFAILAGAIWLGITISALANGLISGGVNFSRQGALMLVRYAYWLLVMVITAYIASQPGMLKRIVRWLGWGVLFLALLRWTEILLFQNIGAWTGTRFATQNTYGLLFSAYSPFMLVRVAEERGAKRLLSTLGYLVLLGAVAVNGSRGSWVAIAIGLAIFLLVMAFTQSRRFVGVALLLFMFGMAAVVLVTSLPALYEPIEARFDTLDSLDTDKSYQIRQLMNQKSLALFMDSPLVGVGVTRFRQVSVPLEIPRLLRYAPQEHFDAKTPHNSYMSFLAENGLLGAVPLAALIMLLAVRGGKAAVAAVKHRQYAPLAVVLSFVQISIHMWAINNFGNTGPWFIYGLVGAAVLTTEVWRKRTVG